MTTTPQGIAHCQDRLETASTDAELELRRANLGDHYRNHPQVNTTYLTCKRRLSK